MRAGQICIEGKKRGVEEGGGYILGTASVSVCLSYCWSHVSVCSGVKKQLLSGEFPDICSLSLPQDSFSTSALFEKTYLQTCFSMTPVSLKMKR